MLTSTPSPLLAAIISSLALHFFNDWQMTSSLEDFAALSSGGLTWRNLARFINHKLWRGGAWSPPHPNLIANASYQLFIFQS
jgi:hypothetical protein